MANMFSDNSQTLIVNFSIQPFFPLGAAIFFEFKHYKPKKRFTSTKCFAFMEMDEIKPGAIVIEL